MLADLDPLLTAVFCTADDLLPEAGENARRRVTDAEVVTLCVAQQVMNISSDREFLAVAEKRLGHLFPALPKQPGWHKRRRRLSETIEWLIGVFAADSPGHSDPVVLVDSTPVECGRSVETSRRSQLADVCDKGYRSADFEREVRERFGARILRPRRKDEPPQPLNVSKLRQHVESIFWTLKDRLGLERHGARTLQGIRARIASKLLALAAGIWLNHQLGNPSRAFATLA